MIDQRDDIDPIVTVCHMFLETCTKYEFDFISARVKVPKSIENLMKNLDNLTKTYYKDTTNERK